MISISAIGEFVILNLMKLIKKNASKSLEVDFLANSASLVSQ